MGDQFALKNNQIFVLAEAAGGVYNSDQLRILCEVADSESAFLKITEDQRIGFMVDPNKLADVQAQVRKSGLLLRSYKSAGVPSPRACLGELCTFAHQPSLGDALELTTHLLKSFPAPKRYSSIGVNGCQRACLGSSTEDIHIVAEESGYKISIGGKSSDIPQQAQLILENIQRADLPVVVEKLLAVFYQESQENERICDVIDRIGLTPFLDSLPEHLVPVVAETDISSAVDLGDAVPNMTGPENLAEDLSAQLDTGDTTAGSDVANSLDDSLDDLLESSSKEFADGTPTEISGTEPNAVDGIADLDLKAIDDGGALENSAADASLDTPDVTSESSDDMSDGLAGELLEVAESDLEEGSLEDVERVRDAIRTELSLAPSADQSIRPQTDELLDDLPEESEGMDDSFTDASNDLSTSGTLDGLDDVLAETDALADAADAFEEETAAHIEHKKPAPQKPTRAQAAPQRQRDEPTPRAAVKPVGGRLSIRFVGEQLSVELPSGLSFELPFESVAEGSELSMSLPDGELRIQRDGQLLAVNLGMLNLKIPVPEFSDRQVA